MLSNTIMNKTNFETLCQKKKYMHFIFLAPQRTWRRSLIKQIYKFQIFGNFAINCGLISNIPSRHRYNNTYCSQKSVGCQPLNNSNRNKMKYNFNYFLFLVMHMSYIEKYEIIV